jgi:SSS family solute:Na+ symporter
MLSFYIFVFLLAAAILVSLADRSPVVYQPGMAATEYILKPARRVKIAWILLVVVMICLYLIFNGH